MQVFLKILGDFFKNIIGLNRIAPESYKLENTRCHEQMITTIALWEFRNRW